MKFSVLINNFNYGTFIGQAIESVLAQTYPAYEIIVVDDGSTDNSRDVIQSYGDKIIPIFQENAGQASAMNTGFSRATGDIICFLDSDDFFVPQKLEILNKVYSEHDDISWVFHDLKEIFADESKNIFDGALNCDVKFIDERKSICDGKIAYDAPATSGLTFKKSCLDGLMPLPVVQSIYISDHYIKFFALANGKGAHISAPIGGQIIHGSNLYTGQKQYATRAKIFTNTALALRKIKPDTRRFCNSLFVEGRSWAIATGIAEELRPIVTEYCHDLSPFELLLIELRVLMKSRRYKKKVAD